jgi:hypothetical protein
VALGLTQPNTESEPRWRRSRWTGAAVDSGRSLEGVPVRGDRGRHQHGHALLLQATRSTSPPLLPRPPRCTLACSSLLQLLEGNLDLSWDSGTVQNLREATLSTELALVRTHRSELEGRVQSLDAALIDAKTKAAQPAGDILLMAKHVAMATKAAAAAAEAAAAATAGCQRHSNPHPYTMPYPFPGPPLLNPTNSATTPPMTRR